MNRIGIGLKPLIALQLLVALVFACLLFGYASWRLARYALIVEQTRTARAVLQKTKTALFEHCPDAALLPTCGLGDWIRRQRTNQPLVVSLALFDADGTLVESSEAAQGVRALWDALGMREMGGGPGNDWAVFKRGEQRILVVSQPTHLASLTLRGEFSLADLDRSAANLGFQMLVYGALIVAVMLIVSWVLLTRLLVRPIDRLLGFAGRISEGDLSFLLQTESGNELGRLGVSFSQMARRIEDDKQKLKMQIEKLESLNHELNQAQIGLIRSEKLASVGRLAAGLAHEVGNPLAAILGYVEMLKTERFPIPEQQDILNRVQREVERVDGIIRNLLAYSRPGRSLITAVSPAAVVEEALALLRPQKKFKQVVFEALVPHDLPSVLADFDLIRQALVNLLLNALDAVAAGGHLWVRAVALRRSPDGGLLWNGASHEPDFFSLGDIHCIRPPRDGRDLIGGREVVVFSVVDDGQGIPPENLLKVFDPFFTTKEPGKGTGLGLAMCHAGVTAMGGEIWVYSRQGVGTQFAFLLNVAKKEGP
jgi:two-component system NtrC family sensor kinase